MTKKTRRSYLVIGGVALVKQRIRPPANPVMVAVTKDLCDPLWECEWLCDAPFNVLALRRI